MTPGPGSYDYKQNPSKNNAKKRTKSVGTAVHEMKEKYKIEYQAKREPTLATDPVHVPEKVEKKVRVKGGLKWGLNQRDRFEEMYKNEGENRNEENHPPLRDRKKEKPLRESSVFVSKSVKSCFDCLVYKTSNPFKAELRKMLGFEDEDPGPGSYNLEADLQRGKKLGNNRFQFFGSTAHRFDHDGDEAEQLSPGPGHYFEEHKTFKSKTKKPKKSKKNPIGTNKEDSNDVGPGYYNNEKVNAYPSTYNYHNFNGTGTFGSKVPRFEEQQERPVQKEAVPLLLEENEQRRQRIEEEFNYRRNLLKNKKHASFLSETKRDCFQRKEDSPFGLYEVGLQDINHKLKKQKEHAQQFSECNLYRPPFLSSVDRFKQKPEPEQTHKDCWCLVKEVEKKNIEHGSSMFESAVERSVVFNEKYRSPPVGQYSKPSSLIRESFNSKFIKASQNKGKKLQLWGKR